METKTNLPAIQQTQGVTSFNFFDPTQFETMQRVCKMFANSDLVPDMYKAVLEPLPPTCTEEVGKPIIAKNKAAESKAMANCMIAIEMAQRIGASPLMIMQNMVIIYGRPSFSSKFLIATVNACGRFEPIKYRITNLGNVGKVSYTDYVWNGSTRRKEPIAKEFDGTKIENLQCVAYTTGKGSDEVLESAPIDIRLAIQEGWYTKAGSKWVPMTRQMLMYRAASFWTNAYAPELSMGMKTEEEIRDIIDVEYEDVSEKVEKEKQEKANKKTITIDPVEPVKDPELTKSTDPAKEPSELFETQGTQPAPSTPGF